ncbi:MAG TPA: ABC transporter ATP-binding protein [Actinomycetota bacterium]|nr:ABC transporter ATP-binding protein [Actinomycetota bacterium]
MVLELQIARPLRDLDVDVTLEVRDETVAVVGPSGAGKTTLLRAIAGLDRGAVGRVVYDGNVWLDPQRGIFVAPEDRTVGYVFQDPTLFPHMSVRDNVAFGARSGVDPLLDRLGIGTLADADPVALSGGEAQRVALARALAREPGVLLLDEPTASLDVATRREVTAVIAHALAERKRPAVLVTHDFEEAATLGDRVAVIADGKLVQIGTADDLVARPTSPVVASLSGANVLRGTAEVVGGLTEVRLDRGHVVYSTDIAVGPTTVAVYPWDVAVANDRPTDSTLNHIEADITSVVRLGNRVRVRIGPITAEVTEASADRLHLAEGMNAVASFKATATRLLT